jgi:AraC family transcriptional regulator
MKDINTFDTKLPDFTEADIHVLYESDFYRVLDFRCRCADCKTSKPEYTDAFAVSFVRKGNFLFNVFRNSLDSYTGCILVTKPGTERTVSHIHTVPDECTIFEFKSDFYERIREQYPGIKFLSNVDLHSTLVKINPATELLHYHIVKLVLNKGAKLEIDNLVLDLIETAFANITDYKPDLDIHDRLKTHLVTLERAKMYINEHFAEDISLKQVAESAFVSPFHFSRLFKAMTSYSPHQFLLNVRLKKSEILLRNTSMPIMQVAFASGFNSVEHFTTAFSAWHGCPPARYRSGADPMQGFSQRFPQINAD